MTIREAAAAINGRVVACEDAADRPVNGGYASDLLSDVIANARDGDLWLTLQKHSNIVAVAHLRNLAGVVVVNGREPEADTIARATQAQVPLVVTPLDAFEAAGALHGLGLRGRSCPESVHA